MLKSVVALSVVVSLSACGGSTSKSDSSSAGTTSNSKDTVAPSRKSGDFSSASEIKSALDAAGLTCAGYKTVAKADREFGQESAVDVAECEVEGENVQLVVWKDNGQRDNFSGMARGFGCEMAKAFGIQSFDWVDGDKWQVTGTSGTLAKQIDNALDGKARHVDC